VQRDAVVAIIEDAGNPGDAWLIGGEPSSGDTYCGHRQCYAAASRYPALTVADGQPQQRYEREHGSALI